MPGVLTEENGHLAVLEIALHMAAEHHSVDPELAGFLLRQGIGAVLHAQHPAGGGGVTARQVVALPTPAVIEDALPAFPVPQGEQALAHFANGGIPVNGFKAAIGQAPQGGGQAVPAVLVVVQAGGFLAEIALGGGVRLVAADADDLALIFPAQLDLDAAVALAQDAGAGLPVRHDSLPQVPLATREL